MAIRYVFIALLIALASADQELDQLEQVANKAMASVHSFLGGQSGQNSLYSFINDGSFAREAAEDMAKTRKERIEEAVGSDGKTFVSVRKGKKQVNVTVEYGVGAGAVISLREEDRETDVDEATFDDLRALTDPLYEQHVDPYAEPEGDEVTVVLGHEGRTDLGLKDSKVRDSVKVHGGFKVGAKVKVSKK